MTPASQCSESFNPERYTIVLFFSPSLYYFLSLVLMIPLLTTKYN